MDRTKHLERHRRYNRSEKGSARYRSYKRRLSAARVIAHIEKNYA